VGTGVGAGLGTGVGAGVGTGVVTGVGAGVGMAVGRGTGAGVAVDGGGTAGPGWPPLLSAGPGLIEEPGAASGREGALGRDRLDSGIHRSATGGCPESAGPVGPPCQGNRSEPVAEGRTTVDVTARMVTSVTTRKARTKTLTLADRGISPRV
jgi:hypothetical protein